MKDEMQNTSPRRVDSSLILHPSSFLRYWLPPLLWAALIFAASSVRTPPKPPVMPGFPWDKLAHAIEYAVLGMLLYRAFAELEQFSKLRAVLLGIVFATAYGFSDELHQFFVGRDCEAVDILTDFAGAVVGTVVYMTLFTRSAHNQP